MSHATRVFSFTSLLVMMLVFSAVAGADEVAPVPFETTLDTVCEHDDGKFLWFHPRAATVPGKGAEGNPAIIMTLQKHLQVSDFYSGLYELRSNDLGKTWTGPTEIPELVA